MKGERSGSEAELISITSGRINRRANI